MKKEHFDFLKTNQASEDGLKWAETQSDLYELWNNCHRGDWMLWLAKRLKVDEKKQVLCAALCAHTVIHLMEDRRSREAVRTAFLYARGKATDVQLHEAGDATAATAATAAWAAVAGERLGSALRTAEIARKILTQDVFEKISTL